MMKRVSSLMAVIFISLLIFLQCKNSTRPNDKQLDNNAYFREHVKFQYDNNGNCVLWLSYDSIGVLNAKGISMYDNHNNCIAYTQYRKEIPIYSYQYTYQYDSHGNILEQKEIVNNSCKIKEIFEYDNEGNIIEKWRFDFSAPRFDTTHYKYLYNRDNEIIEKIEEHPSLKEFTTDKQIAYKKYQYKYDNTGKKNNLLYSSNLHGNSYFQYIYLSLDGKSIEECVDTTNKCLIYRKVYVNKNLVEEFNGKYKLIRNYDSKGNVVRTFCYEEQDKNKFSPRFEIACSYDSLGNRIEKKVVEFEKGAYSSHQIDF